MYRTVPIFILSLLWFLQPIFSQKPSLQVQASGGYTIPMKPLTNASHFSENGWNANGGFSLYFGKYGIMTRGGFQRLAASPGFESFVFNQYKEVYKNENLNYWENAFGMIGPAFKWSKGRFDLDFFVLIGMSKLSVPDLVFSKNFFGQDIEIARYYGKNDELIPFWSGGLTLHTRLYKGLSLTLEPSFVSNQYLSSTLTTFRYVNAFDNNNNGYIDDVEFSEAEIKKQIEDVFFANVNLNVGLSYQFGKEVKSKDPVSMIPLEEAEGTEAPAQVQTIPAEEEKASGETGETNNNNTSGNPTLPAENAADQGPVSQDSTRNSQQNYDRAEANFLYKAGELYYQNNDFENAVACFNKLKNNEEQSMAKYMFALSLCEMLNCEEAAKEYADFEKKYKAGDSGVLYTVFKSQFEKCRKNLAEQEALLASWDEEKAVETNQINTGIAQEDLTKGDQKETNKSQSGKAPSADETSEKGITYRIQFVALRFSNKNFPRLENIGKITHEFFPQRSMYRYTLGPYLTEDEAVSDMLKVRVMGFDDAFLAEYKGGHRTNTLYHAQ